MMPAKQPSPISEQAERYMSELAREVRELSVDKWGEERAIELVGQSPNFLELQAKLRKVARYREPVLITGESGVGKELLAQAIYLLGETKGRPYVSVNCPQYREGNLTASELFGHRKGSFTGAVADRKGAFESAHGGVIFLDEVGDLHQSAQPMLLRALASGEFKPLGDDRSRSADVRVIAATNRPLNQLLMTQEFRHDLFFRLRYFLLDVPPLREREDDWRLVLDYRLLALSEKYGVRKDFSAEALRVLESYDWSGNIRELITVATMGYAMADGDTIEPGDFQLEAPHLPDFSAPQPSAAPAVPPPPKTISAEEDLYQRVVEGKEDFWDAVYRPFMHRDLNRSQVRQLVECGLRDNTGSYRRLVASLGMPSSDYHCFMAFLRHHDLKP